MRVEILTRLLCAWILETLLQGPRYSAWFHGQLVLTPSLCRSSRQESGP
jgi:hypothetical protein